MKKSLIVLAVVGITTLAGCTGKTRLITGATSVKAINPSALEDVSCKNVGSLLVEDKHPRNINKDVINAVYLSGATHYKVTDITQVDYKNRPTGFAVDIFTCK